MTNIRTASCKICGKNMVKKDLPKTESGFVGHVDDNGKRWMARVCPDCMPSVRKERYRKPIELPEVIKCAGCGMDYVPKQKRTTVCSNKCRNRVKRKESFTQQGKQTPVKLKLE